MAKQRPTRRQLEVLRAYIRAGSVAAAAYELGISETTARQHLSGLYRRTGCLNAAHNGSVWPHDNAILAAGLMRYGLADEAHRVILSMLDVAVRSNGRLPELFSGIARNDVGVPVAYPASCSPQAWAAAAPLLFLRTLLRFDPSMTDGRVWCSPSLPRNIERLSIDEFPLGGARLRLRISPDGWSLDGLPDGVELIEAPRSPGALGAGGDSFMSRSPVRTRERATTIGRREQLLEDADSPSRTRWREPPRDTVVRTASAYAFRLNSAPQPSTDGSVPGSGLM